MGDFLITHARIATMRGARYGWIEDGALLARSGTIGWIGATASLPAPAPGDVEVVDARGALLTPGLIDCHTHLVYAGDRSAEHALRREGATYAQIAAAGGGILATVRATRAENDAELAQQALARLDALACEGVTTVEIKSGYGLDVATEMRCLRVARGLAASRPMRIETTLLGAHALAPEFAGRADDYIALVCEEMIPRVARERLAGAVDAFCEGVGFTPEQVRRVFEAARRHGLAVKLHADQLSNLGGAALAAEFHALSADHLEYTDAAGVAAMAAAGTVAVLLPGAYAFLGERQAPPVPEMRRLGVPMAVATDCNPGTSPTTSLLTMMNLACELFGLSAEEALAGVTHQAARALGRSDRGCLECGRLADCVLWDLEDPRDLAAATGARRPARRFFAS